jgi:hypothetical protein
MYSLATCRAEPPGVCPEPPTELVAEQAPSRTIPARAVATAATRRRGVPLARVVRVARLVRVVDAENMLPNIGR